MSVILSLKHKSQPADSEYEQNVCQAIPHLFNKMSEENIWYFNPYLKVRDEVY